MKVELQSSDEDGHHESRSITIAQSGKIQAFICNSMGGVPTPNLLWTLGNESIGSIRTEETLVYSNVSSKLEVELVSFISIPVSKGDNGKTLICEVIHPALTESLIWTLTINVHYPLIIKRVISFPLFLLETQTLPLYGTS